MKCIIVYNINKDTQHKGINGFRISERTAEKKKNILNRVNPLHLLMNTTLYSSASNVTKIFSVKRKAKTTLSSDIDYKGYMIRYVHRCVSVTLKFCSEFK